jgi:FlaA1/EpsC-like NDP-sugar epimerase
LLEECPEEAVKNNISGTKNLVEAAHNNGTGRFVLISTDQAVNPTSIIGASKNVAEQILRSYSNRSSTRFISVRFGNVLGSRGSVLPLFRSQIESGGPVTVTHPKMVRYFLTVSESVKLVLQSTAYGKGGEIFVFDMGEPVKIVDLAEDLIRLSGYEPGEDIKIEFTGIKPGEKLYEELLASGEGVTPTRNRKIFIAQNEDFSEGQFFNRLDNLEKAATKADSAMVIKILREMVPSFSPNRDSIHNENREIIPGPPRLRVIEPNIS